MLQEILAQDRNIITYRKELNKLTGSVTATLLLSQLLYWWHKNGRKEFYKFRCGTDSEGNPIKHIDYRTGDSLCEELGFSERELDTALSAICQKTSKLKEGAKNDTRNNLIAPYVFSRQTLDRKTYYSINEILLEEHLTKLYSEIGNLQNVDYETYKSGITKPTKCRFDYITETTTKTTNKETKKENTQSKNFANSPSSFEVVSFADNNSINSMQKEISNVAGAENQKSNAKEKTKDGGGEFEIFCNAYPNNKGKYIKTTINKFNDAVKKVGGIDKLLLCVENYKTFVDTERKNGFPNLAYKNLATFLNGSYLDFLVNEKQILIDNSPKYKGISLATEVNMKIAGGAQSKLDLGFVLRLAVKNIHNLHNITYNGLSINPNEIETITQLLKNTKYEN
jgi:hypothetical protein